MPLSSSARDLWERYDGDLVTAFKQFQDSNNLEIITCGATHGYLPLMKMYPQAVWAQFRLLANTTSKTLVAQKVFGCRNVPITKG